MSSNDSDMEITTINFPLVVMASIIEMLPLDWETENIILPIVWEVWNYCNAFYDNRQG